MMQQDPSEKGTLAGRHFDAQKRLAELWKVLSFGYLNFAKRLVLIYKPNSADQPDKIGERRKNSLYLHQLGQLTGLETPR